MRVYYEVEIDIYDPREQQTHWKLYDRFATKSEALACIKKLRTARLVECSRSIIASKEP